MDPHAVLGLAPDATLADAAAAHRRLAKEHHPDVTPDPRSALVMAQVNAAFDALRDRAAATGGSITDPAWSRGATVTADHAGADPADADPAGAGARMRRGAWLPEATRRALGPELLAALEHEEDVVLVVKTATWASPEALLALTDRRLLWLADDQPTHRVRSLRFRDVQHVDHRLAWPRRRGTASVRLRAATGRRFDFGDLKPDVARRIAGAVAAAR